MQSLCGLIGCCASHRRTAVAATGNHWSLKAPGRSIASRGDDPVAGALFARAIACVTTRVGAAPARKPAAPLRPMNRRRSGLSRLASARPPDFPAVCPVSSAPGWHRAELLHVELPFVSNQSAHGPEVSAYWLAPSHWLLRVPVAGCARTLLARAQVLLVPLRQVTGYDIFVERDYAEYLREWVALAARI